MTDGETRSPPKGKKTRKASPSRGLGLSRHAVETEHGILFPIPFSIPFPTSSSGLKPRVDQGAIEGAQRKGPDMGTGGFTAVGRL